MINEADRCPTCVYFDKMDAKGGGLCRKSAPAVIARVETVTHTPSSSVPLQLTTKAHTSFPYVRASDWCGEHLLDTSL